MLSNKGQPCPLVLLAGGRVMIGATISPLNNDIMQCQQMKFIYIYLKVVIEKDLLTIMVNVVCILSGLEWLILLWC